MIIFTLRRLVLLIVTLSLLTLVGFSLSYYTPNAPLNGAALFDAYHFYLTSLLQGDFGRSSINGQAISELLKEVFPPRSSFVCWPLRSRCWSVFRWALPPA